MSDELEYHEICLWSPFYQETIDRISKNMAKNGFDTSQPIIKYEGKILDGRHRYLAAKEAGVEPVFKEFTGTREDAVGYATTMQHDRGHWNKSDIEFFYVKTSEALGVNPRGANQHPTNVGTSPSAKEYADRLGVSDRTIERWEKDRKEIEADPELSKFTQTPEEYKKAKDVVKQRREAIRNTEEPKVIDLGAIARNTEHTDIRKIGPAFIANMEILCTKFDQKDIKRELVAFMEPDPLGLKVKALHEMSGILTDLCDDYPEIKSTDVN